VQVRLFAGFYEHSQAFHRHLQVAKSNLSLVPYFLSLHNSQAETASSQNALEHVEGRFSFGREPQGESAPKVVEILLKRLNCYHVHYQLQGLAAKKLAIKGIPRQFRLLKI
jgi:hypothetical protein